MHTQLLLLLNKPNERNAERGSRRSRGLPSRSCFCRTLLIFANKILVGFQKVPQTRDYSKIYNSVSIYWDESNSIWGHRTNRWDGKSCFKHNTFAQTVSLTWTSSLIARYEWIKFAHHKICRCGVHRTHPTVKRVYVVIEDIASVLGRLCMRLNGKLSRKLISEVSRVTLKFLPTYHLSKHGYATIRQFPPEITHAIAHDTLCCKILSP